MPNSERNYLEDDNIPRDGALRGKETFWPTNFIASRIVTTDDSNVVAQQKNLSVYVGISNIVLLLVMQVSWTVDASIIAWSLLSVFSFAVAMGVGIVMKQHAYFRHWCTAIGLVFILISYISHNCQPSLYGGGRMFVATLTTVSFLIPMGASVMYVSIVLSAHFLSFILYASLEGGGVTCISSDNPPSRDPSGVVFAQLLIPLLWLLVSLINMQHQAAQADIQTELSETFARQVIRAALKNDLDGVKKCIDAYDESQTPNPSMSDDAISVMYDVLEEMKKMVPAHLTHDDRKPSATTRLSSFQFLNATPVPETATSSREPSDDGDKVVDFAIKDEEMPSSMVLSPDKQGNIRRRASRVTMLDLDESPSLHKNSISGSRFSSFTRPASVQKNGAFIVCFSLPRLGSYTQRIVADMDLTRLFLTEFVDHVNQCIAKYDGKFMFSGFGRVYAKFEQISTACAAALALLELLKRERTHHKDPVLNESKAHMPFVVILHAELIHGLCGSDAATRMNISQSSADAVFGAILENVAGSIIDPPMAVMAPSLRYVAGEHFYVAESPHSSLLELTKPKHVGIDGLPEAPMTTAARTGVDEQFSLPDVREFDPREIAAALLDHEKSHEHHHRHRNQSHQSQHQQIPHVASYGSGSGESSLNQSDQLADPHSFTQHGRKKRLPQEVIDVWNRFDSDGNGFLDVDEIRDLIEDIGMVMTDEELKVFFDEVDADHSGSVNMEEFADAFFSSALGGTSVMSDIRRAAVAMSNNTGVDNLPIVLNAWKKYDADGSGQLEAKEIGAILNDLGMKHTEEEIEWLVQKMDKNGNGSIDFEEFASLFSEDDTANKKLNAAKERIQTVARVMQNKSSGKIYSNPDQSLRDQRVRIGDFVADYMHLPLFFYIFYNFGSITFGIAMGTDQQIPTMQIVIDLVLDLLYIAWFCLKLAWVPLEVKGQVLFHRADMIRHHIRSVEFWVDALVVVPMDFVFIGSGAGVIAFFRANKLLSLYHGDSLYKILTARYNPALVRAANAFVYFFIFSHLFGCAVIWLTRDIGQAVMTDMVGSDALIDNRDTLYPKAWYWAILTLAGQLKGEALPPEDSQLILLTVAVLVGLPLYTVVLGTVGNAVNVEDAYTRYLGKIDDVRGFFTYTKMPVQFEVECVAYYRHVFDTTGSLDIEQNPMDDLPVELSIQVTVQIGREMLKTVPIFADACKNLEFVHELTTKLVPKVVEPGAIVMKKGERGTNMYFVTFGDFNVVTDEGIAVFTIKKGNFFGEIALLHNVKRTATIQCSKTRYGNALVLDKKQFDEVTTTFPEALSKVYKAAEERIKQILEKEAEEAKAAKEKRRAEKEAERKKAEASGLDLPIDAESSGSSSDDEDQMSQGGSAIDRLKTSVAAGLQMRTQSQGSGLSSKPSSRSNSRPGSSANLTRPAMTPMTGASRRVRVAHIEDQDDEDEMMYSCSPRRSPKNSPVETPQPASPTEIPISKVEDNAHPNSTDASDEG